MKNQDPQPEFAIHAIYGKELGVRLLVPGNPVRIYPDAEAFMDQVLLRDYLEIEKVPWDLIILDKGQRIKNWETKTSRILKSLSSPFALVLSGTPLENLLEELYSMVQFIDDRRLGPAYRFLRQHRMVNEDGKVIGYCHHEKIQPPWRMNFWVREPGNISGYGWPEKFYSSNPLNFLEEGSCRQPRCP